MESRPITDRRGDRGYWMLVSPDVCLRGELEMESLKAQGLVVVQSWEMI